MYEMCGRSHRAVDLNPGTALSWIIPAWTFLTVSLAVIEVSIEGWFCHLFYYRIQRFCLGLTVFYKCWVKCLIWCFTVYERTGRSSGFMLFLIQFPMWSGTWGLPILFSSLKLYQNVMFVNFFNLLWLNCYGNAKHVLLIQRDRTPSVLKLCLHNWCPCLSGAYNIQPYCYTNSDFIP